MKWLHKSTNVTTSVARWFEALWIDWWHNGSKPVWKGVCCLFCSATSHSLSPFQDVPPIFRICIPDTARDIYSVLLSSCFLERPGQNRTSPHWVTEGWLWEGQRALPTPWPFHYGSCLFLTQRWELNNWGSVLVTLYFSLWSKNLPCALYVIPVFHNSFKRLYVQTVVLS